MAKQLQISIPTPCHENWDAMSPVEKGRFCGSCQKQVVDFSNMSDRQVAEFFKKPSTGSVCGRFMTDQLDREIEIPRKRIPWLKYFFQFALPAFLLSLRSSSAKAQGTPLIKMTEKDTTRKKTPLSDIPVTFGNTVAELVPAERYSSERGLLGYVMDARTGTILPAASVTMFSTIGEEHITIKKDGSFHLDIYRKITVKKIVVSCKGYGKRELTLQEFMHTETGKNIVMLEPDNRLICTTWLMGDTFIGKPIEKLVIAEERIIKGNVMDETGEPLPGVSVTLKGSRTGVSADINARFEIRAKTGDIVVVTGAGIERTESTVGAGNTLSIAVKRTSMIGQEVVITLGQADYTITRKKKKEKPVKKEIRNVPLLTATTTNQNFSAIKVFPNPVQAGSRLTIEWKQVDDGDYMLQLTDESGHSIYQREMRIDAKIKQQDIELPQVAAGSYFLVIVNKKTGKKFSAQLIIQ